MDTDLRAAVFPRCGWMETPVSSSLANTAGKGQRRYSSGISGMAHLPPALQRLIRWQSDVQLNAHLIDSGRHAEIEGMKWVRFG